ncbi:MAG: chitobiase/beta-hexosaminidase C-terminal domain-containing protein [Ginsengibacter sp.]
MQRWKTIIFNLTFALNCLLLFLLVFENKIHIPAWLQVVGRMHTMFVHFPIVMLALCIFWELFSGYKKLYVGVKAEIGDELLLAAAITSVSTALMGLFLSREDGYTPDLLVWHKWGGVFISFLSLLWYILRVKVRQIRPVLLTTALAGMIVIIITGHLGANITHGQDFLFAPVETGKEKPVILFEDAKVYTDMVRPVLEAKCMSCHNSEKAKGGLVMETEALLLKGGRNGALWDSTQNDFGLMLRRIHLPPESKKHMPPLGKPQLADEESEVLERWIKSGASFTTKVASLPERDSLRLLAAPLFETIETDNYTFAPPDEIKVKGLNNNYRVVRPLALGSPALGVEFFSAEKFKSEQLKELLAVKEQVVSLNLNKMPVVDEDLKTIGQFFNLRKLNLSFTNITGATLAELSKLKELKSISLSGTKINSGSLKVLSSLPKLTQLFVWKTSIQSESFEMIQKQLKSVSIETGFNGDTVIIKLNPPVIENEEQVITGPTDLKLKHYVKNVTIRYTTDGTEPDSSTSSIYKNDSIVTINKYLTVKAKAFKPGWTGSDVAEKIFYKAGFHPDSVRLVNTPDSIYKADGALTLFDTKKGSANFRDGKWLGYRQKKLEAFLYFNNPRSISSVNISTVIDIASYLMPPQMIEVWGGDNLASLRLLKRIQPEQPLKEKPAYLTGYDATFQPVKMKIFKIIVVPVPKLPSWHKGKGDKGWAFVDEIFLN